MRTRLRRVGLTIGGALLLALVISICVPVPADELRLEEASSLVVLARDGSVLREFTAREGEGHASPAHLDELPPQVWQAFVAAEDGRFFRHPGLDPLAIARAGWVDLKRRRFAQGGSTLTQQVARLIEPRSRTLAGKLREAWLALRLERTLSKRELLEQYLTRVPLGNDVRGVEAAARLYFDRPASSLTPAQAALLAALPRSPVGHDPLRAPQKAEAAARRVLLQMEARGFLSHARTQEALTAPLDLAKEKFRRAFEAPHFVEAIARQEAPRGAVRVRTTLDLELQRKLEEAVRDGVDALEDKRVTAAAAIILDNATGEVLAYVGAPDWFDEDRLGRIDGVRTRRQPGSSLKPFIYGAAIDTLGLTPSTLLSDIETQFATESGAWVPKNYDRKTHGPVRLRVALGSSYNVPAVRVAELLGAPAELDVLHRAGFRSLDDTADHYGVGLVLGNGEVQLSELATGYLGLARGGLAPSSLTYVLRADDAAGNPIPLAHPTSRRFLRANAAGLIADILSDPAARAPAFGLDNALRFPFPVAAKTGTSRAFTDNWTAGFTHERTVAVWVGNMSGQTMQHVSGITGAGPLFHRAMTLAMAHLESPQPLSEQRYEERDVCALSGELAGASCPSKVHEKFIAGHVPKRTCGMHSERGVDLGPQFYDWAHREGIATLQERTAGARASIAFPTEGDEFLREVDLPDAHATIPVRALPADGARALELQLDDGPSEALDAPYSTRVPARAGKHVLRLFKPGANEPDARVRFNVRG
ncbi:MAG: penicillin-binding protein 1C [Deltaproteobacteria bacterium]|nr:penicillin-binding protein 1C [Deltaproteobacteria bacterium]